MQSIKDSFKVFPSLATTGKTGVVRIKRGGTTQRSFPTNKIQGLCKLKQL